MFRFIKNHRKTIVIGFIVGVILSMFASGTMVAASAAAKDTQNGVTVTNFGLDAKDRFRFKVNKAATGLDVVQVAQFEEGTDFGEDDFIDQHVSSYTYPGDKYPGTKVRDGRSVNLTVVVYNKPEQLFYKVFKVSNYKALKKSCDKSSPQIVVKSGYTPTKVTLRIYKKIDGKNVGETIKLFRVLREENVSSYIPTEEDSKKYFKKGWKAGKVVASAIDFKSVTCLRK